MNTVKNEILPNQIFALNSEQCQREAERYADFNPAHNAENSAQVIPGDWLFKMWLNSRFWEPMHILGKSSIGF